MPDKRCLLCGGRTTWSICEECVVAVTALDVDLPPTDADPTEVKRWMAENRVSVRTCRRERPEACRHREHLGLVLAALKDGRADWPPSKVEWFEASVQAFEDMQDQDDFPLADRQYTWVEKVADALDLDLPRAASKPVPRGKPVALLSDAMPRPLKPPERT